MADAEIRIRGGEPYPADSVHVDAGGGANVRMNVTEEIEWGYRYSACSIRLAAPVGTFDRDDCFGTHGLADRDGRDRSTTGDVTGDCAVEPLRQGRGLGRRSLPLLFAEY